MKVLILAGGYGSRISEETFAKPKPMIEIGGRPVLWHIMKIYSSFGFNDFVILCGYKGYLIKEYFANYYRHMADMTIDLKNNNVEYHKTNAEPWKITLVDTGLDTMTGGRIKRVKDYVKGEKFLLTYGDGVADIDIEKLVESHNKNGGVLTMTAVQPEGRFGAVSIGSDDKALSFSEKPEGDGSWINGGFFVCEPEIFEYLDDDSTVFERTPLEKLSALGKLYTYKHTGFWKPMDTLRDKLHLEKLIETNNAPWIRWTEKS